VSGTFKKNGELGRLKTFSDQILTKRSMVFVTQCRSSHQRGTSEYFRKRLIC